MQPYRDVAGSRLVRSLPLAGALDAVNHGVAQHVFEWRQHLLEHLPIQLAGRAFNGELRALARFLRGLPHETG